MADIATEAVAVLTEGIAKGAASGLVGLATRLGALIRDRLGRSDGGGSVLDEALADPEDDEAKQKLIEALREHLDDEELITQVRQILDQFQEVIGAEAESGAVGNVVTGDVGGSVVQARDVTGGITFGDQRPAGWSGKAG